MKKITVVNNETSLDQEFFNTLQNNVEEEFEKYSNLMGTKVLWNNSNETTFERQTITLASSDFDFYEIEFLLVGGGSNTKSTGKVHKSKLAYMDYVGGSGSLVGFDRGVVSLSGTTMIIDNAVRINTGATENTRCIPLRIYGYKIYGFDSTSIFPAVSTTSLENEVI